MLTIIGPLSYPRPNLEGVEEGSEGLNNRSDISPFDEL